MINYNMLGEFEIYKDGKLIDQGPNNITNLGRKWLLDRCVGTGSIIPWMTNGSAYLAVGEGSGIMLAGMSGLINELGTGSVSRAQFLAVNRVNDAGSVITGSATYGGSGARGLISEVGVFVTGYDGATVKTASSTKDSGLLFARRSLNTPNLINSGAVLEIRYKYSIWNS